MKEDPLPRMILETLRPLLPSLTYPMCVLPSCLAAIVGIAEVAVAFETRQVQRAIGYL